ncbi:MAG: hypothetical protein ACOH2G_08510 [Ewingella sp.]
MSKLVLSLAAGALALLLCVSGLAAFWRSQLSIQRRDNQELTAQRDQAQATLKDQIRAVTLFNDISAATLAAHRTDDNDTQKTQTIIKTVIKHDACAGALPPAVAADQLRAHANRLRARSTNTHAGGTAG